MKTWTRSLLLAAVVAVIALAACSKSVPTTTGGDVPDVGDIAGIDPNALKDAGAKISAAGAKCSEAAGTISGLTQQLLKAIKAEDLAAAQAVGTELTAAADQLHQAAAEGLAAADGLSSLPAGAGDQAVKGVSSAFKVCGATGDYAESLGTDVASASGPDAYDELEKAAKELSDKASQAAEEASSAGSGI